MNHKSPTPGMTESSTNDALMAASEASQPDSSSLFEQAEAALVVLTKQVELARVEARKLELETALNLARQGDAEPLRRWLKTNQQLVAWDSNHSTPPSAAQSCSVPSSAAQHNPVHRSAVPHSAMHHSAGLPIETLPSDGLPRDAKSSATWLPQETPANQIASGKAERRETPSRELSWDEIRIGSLKRLDDISRSIGSQDDVCRPKAMDGLGIRGVEDRVSMGQEDRTRRKQRWRLRGVLVSTLVHILLVIMLGVITVSIPLDPGLLELQASESTETSLENFELNSDVEAEVPSEQFEVSTSEWQPDLASTLPDFIASAQSLGDLPTTSDSNGLSSALSATGIPSMSGMAANFYGASATGSCFCFLIDGSATMRGPPWEAARAELLRTLHSLSEKQRFYVIFYNQVISRIPDIETGKPAKSAIYATRENLQHATRWLQSLRVDVSVPGGNHTTVLQAALDLEPDAIFYLTDAEMTPKVEQNLLNMLRKSNRDHDLIDGEIVRTPIHAIAFHSPQGVELMKRIAEENQGQMTFVPKPK